MEQTPVPNALLHARNALFSLDAVRASLQLGQLRPDLLDSVDALVRRLEREIDNLTRQLELQVKAEAQLALAGAKKAKSQKAQ